MNKEVKYVKPELKAHGSVEEVTQATFSGTKLDGDYPRGTPITDPILS